MKLYHRRIKEFKVSVSASNNWRRPIEICIESADRIKVMSLKTLREINAYVEESSKRLAQ